MKKLITVRNVTGLAGVFLLSGCGSSSAGDIIKESIEVVEQAESYNENIVNTIESESESESESETIDFSFKEAYSFDPYTRSKTEFKVGGEEKGFMNVRYVDDTFYLQAVEDSSWIPWDEETEELDPIYSNISINPKESEEAAFNLAVLKQMAEHEEDIEITEEDGQYVLQLSLPDQEDYSDELLESIAYKSAFGEIMDTAKADEEWLFTGLEMVAHIDKESKTLNYQEVKIVSEPVDMTDPNEAVNETLQITYEDYNDVSPIEVPEDIMAMSEEDEKNYVDLNEEGSKNETADMPGVIASGGGSSEGAEDLFISIPPIYQDTKYASTLEGFDVHIPAINSLVPDSAVMIVWSSMATMGEDKWDAWFVLVNRTGEDIKNVDTTFTFENEYGEVLVESMPMSFSEEDYGIIKNGGILPFLVDIPLESQDAFQDVITHVHAWPTVEKFDFERVE